MGKHRADTDLTGAVQRLIKTPGKFLGRTPDRPRSEYFPGRPADVAPTESTEIPAGVQGHRLGQ